MIQEDILKELELWPVWRIKVVLPDVAVPEIEITSAKAKETSPEVVENSPLLKAYESEDGRCVMVHAAGEFTQEEEKLWANICKAMGIKTKLMENNLPVKDFLNKHTPAVLILFGEETAQTVLQSKHHLEDLRGTQHVYKPSLTINVPAIVTYNLKHLLQQLPDKAKAWHDLRGALKLMNL